jgi:hypothetical protein
MDHGAGRFLGVVKLDICGRTFTLPVQALPFERGEDGARAHDGERAAGGFFSAKTGELGIVVEDGSDVDIQAQIERACADAVTHLSRKVLS